MGWTAGALDQPFTSRNAIAFELGEEFASRVIDTARYGTVIYAAVRAPERDQVFGLVLLAERSGGILYTKPISEDMGPAEDCCPERILDLLTEPSNEYAEDWRSRCRARIERGRPKPGQAVRLRPVAEVSRRHRAPHPDLREGIAVQVPRGRALPRSVLVDARLRAARAMNGCSSMSRVLRPSSE